MTTFVPYFEEEDVLPSDARENFARLKELNASRRIGDEDEKFSEAQEENSETVQELKRELALSTHAIVEKEISTLERGIMELETLLSEEEVKWGNGECTKGEVCSKKKEEVGYEYGSAKRKIKFYGSLECHMTDKKISASCDDGAGLCFDSLPVKSAAIENLDVE